MKKSKYLIIIFLLFSTFVKSQTLVDTNKIWSIVTCINFGGCGTDVIYFGSDTTIGAHQYKKFLVNNDSGGIYLHYPPYAREDTVTKQVFYFDGMNEYLVYDFSLNKGDTFLVCGGFGQLTVDSVDTVLLLNGEVRKRFFLNGMTSDIWIEGIGSLFGLNFEAANLCFFDLYPELSCFKENGILKYHNGNYATCFVNTVGIDKSPPSNCVEIIPNPFSTFTTIKFDNPRHENCTISVYNILGQKIRQIFNITSDEIKIERDKLVTGTYFFQLINEKRLIAKGTLIVQ